MSATVRVTLKQPLDAWQYQKGSDVPMWAIPVLSARTVEEDEDATPANFDRQTLYVRTGGQRAMAVGDWLVRYRSSVVHYTGIQFRETFEVCPEPARV